MTTTTIALAAAVLGCGDYLQFSRPADLARAAVSSDAGVAAQAIDALRGMGPDGIRALVDVHGAALDAYAASFDRGELPTPTPFELRLATAVDGVGAQRDNFMTRHYWHTDLEAAKVAAQAAGKPILSLHMLGELDEEYSCANSRFFRTVVYNHASVVDAMRDRFILHWETVRPIPEITIDFGDGRSIHRTVTGNSCHFVLDELGRPIDAIPGLYGPVAFRQQLDNARRLFESLARVNGEARAATLATWHAAQARSARIRWARDLDIVGASFASNTSSAPGAAGAAGAAGTSRAAGGPGARGQRGAPVSLADIDPGVAAPDALSVMPIAVSKSGVESPLVRQLITPPSVETLDEATSDETWKLIAKAHLPTARMDEGGRRLMRKKSGADTDTAATAEQFETSMALDTVRNEYVLHRRVHAWFAAGEVGGDSRRMSARVYDELFRSPHSDPWLGLLPANTFAALDAGGICR